MIKEELTNIHIEHRGNPKYWNITMYVTPKRCDAQRGLGYAELVKEAENVLRGAKGLGKEWFASNAEVMAWSSRDNRGVLTPYRFRVTLDMVTKDMEAPTDEDV